MAVSKKRVKAVYKPPRRAGKEKKNPAWLMPTMVGCFLVGIAWILVYYVSQAKFPISSFGNGNLLVGFGLFIIGFLLLTRWR